MKRCPKCKREWPDTGKFCPMDGTPLEDMEEDDEQEDLSTQILEEEDKDEEKDEAAADVSAKAPEPVEPAPAKSKKGSAGRKKGEPFSETKWFMVGETVKEQEVEAEDRPLDDLQDVYKQTRTLPPDVRKKFSLKYGAKDDDKGSGKKKKS